MIAKTKTITSIILNFGYKMEVNFAQRGFVCVCISFFHFQVFLFRLSTYIYLFCFVLFL